MSSSSRRRNRRSRKKNSQPVSDGADDAQFTKALNVTGTDGYLGIVGEYHLKNDLFEGFPRYEKIGVDPKRRGQRRFLTHFNLNLGHWVFSDWDGMLLLGPVADKFAVPKSPEKYEGKYEVCKEARRRCKGVVNLSVKPLKTPSSAAASSSSAEQQQPVENPQSGENEDDFKLSDNELVDDDGRSTCKKHRLELCKECGVDFVLGNEEITKLLKRIRFTDKNGFWYCRAHRKESCDICCESHGFHNELLRARLPGQEIDEDARAVRQRFFQQLLDDARYGTVVNSEDDDPNNFDLSAADRKTKCEYCGKKGTFKCKRCNFTYYCSKAHQAAHKAKHQVVCDQLEGVKLTEQMENLLRWVGPPQSDDDVDNDDNDTEDFFDPHLTSGVGYTNDARYQGSYEEALVNAFDFQPDARDPRFWVGGYDDEDDDDDEEEDEWLIEEEQHNVNSSKEENHENSKQSDASESKTTASSVPQKEDSAPSSKVCAHCGQGGKLSLCSRCKVAYYCSREHQLAHYPTHKRGCRLLGEATPPAQKPGVKNITWKNLEQNEPYPAQGKTLEVRIITEPQPLFLRGVCDGLDSQGHVRRLAFYCNQLPKGLKKGCVLRWRNPLFHYFMDGSCGVRIEDEDLLNVTCSES